jgi:hypothetical protein
MKPFRKELFKEQLNDKLYMFNQVDQISHDPHLQKSFNVMMKRCKDMQKASEKMGIR